MLDISTLAIFMTAALALLLIPGPAVLFIVARSIEQGRLAGLASIIGILVGTMVHVLAAAAGVSAILLSSALAFNVVKFLGAGYLVYLGVRTLLSKEEAPTAVSLEPKKLSRLFYEGVLVNVLNPKTALFFLAFLPQFVDPARGSAAVQTILLGLIFIGMALVTDSLYALLAGTLGDRLKNNAKFWRRQRYFAGSVYILLGVTAVFTGSEK